MYDVVACDTFQKGAKELHVEILDGWQPDLTVDQFYVLRHAGVSIFCKLSDPHFGHDDAELPEGMAEEKSAFETKANEFKELKEAEPEKDEEGKPTTTVKEKILPNAVDTGIGGATVIKQEPSGTKTAVNIHVKLLLVDPLNDYLPVGTKMTLRPK